MKTDSANLAVAVVRQLLDQGRPCQVAASWGPRCYLGWPPVLHQILLTIQ